ncbi:MAG TPA: methylated-DNA--[protein]-cysteine S-methyltransferase [Pseudogracilibacillus sp.]|nr:methylated-DNA--[protein]-cysteine S-methyltransferase [Pseudogracilibacillus sp.]
MQNIYYTTLEVGSIYLFIAKTNDGLCYVSSNRDSAIILTTQLRTKNISHRLINDEKIVKVEREQLREYFLQKRSSFDVPLDQSLIGTDFQRLVWKTLRTIPYGTTTTYSEIAHKIGQKRAVRAVANAVGKNPLLIITPCHRVIRKDGSLSGFRDGIAMKRTLLYIENITL